MPKTVRLAHSIKTGCHSEVPRFLGHEEPASHVQPEVVVKATLAVDSVAREYRPVRGELEPTKNVAAVYFTEFLVP
jgi:hypothetical protein